MVAAVSFVAAALLLSDAAGIWPYDLNLLRWAVSGCAAMVLLGSGRGGVQWPAILLAILILFNPLFAVRLPHASLMGLEMIAGICFLAAGFVLYE